MVTNTKELWGNCLSLIEGELSKANFNTWFKNTFILEVGDGTLILGVPNEFVRDWLKSKYEKTILKTIINFEDSVRNIEFEIATIDKTPKEDIYIGGNKEKDLNQLPLSDLYINKNDNLNPKYTFDRFIVGPFNELAHAASQAIIKNPGEAYNPFFVYGGTGLGKTHLLQATGNSIKKKFKDAKIYYTTLEKFSIDYINSLQTNKPNEFKEKYRKYDVCIIDDIQFLSGKEKTQEELFHLFNELYEKGKQIIFSSDKHPNYISGLEDRLKSRFQAGMIVQITEPDYESRMAILKAKIKEGGYNINQETLEYVVKNVDGNVRELEGVFNSVVFQSQLKKKSLSIGEVSNLIKHTNKPKKNISIKELISYVSDFYSVDESSVYDKTRRKEVVKARQVIMYLLREELNISFPMIGQKLGGKDHTTVIHSCMKIKKDLKNDSTLVDEIERIRSVFK